ncbi:MAG: YkgJ family cysteine cluster protein [Opitutae bacterium]|nr:YkgJ family cysteine cluster protein [Opitutae bacterium]
MEIPEDCLQCGVCCFAKSGTYVRVSEADWRRLGDDADRVARHVGGQAYMRMTDGHCGALHITTTRGAPPVFFCELYTRRPQVCRNLARGSQACQTELRCKAARVAEEYGR